MRNLKKVLSLVLCMAMMLSIMVVGAGAAFKDQSKIVNEEAVDMCAALNIINGYTDGSFKPEGTITRAEACKMICVALNGGKEPVLGTNATATFTDIKGHWAEGYIEYCVSEGIVAGIGGGKFNPNGNVTGSQFAKMLLIALGYRADHEKFVGNAWEVNVNVKATQKGLYEDLATMDPSVALTRDNAAQMVWNALQAKEVKYEYTLVSENGQLVSKVNVADKGITLMADKYGVIDDESAIMTGFSYDEDKGEWTYYFDQHSQVERAYENDNFYNISFASFTSDVDYTDLFQQNVKVVYTVKNNKVDTVYGMFAYDSAVLATSVVGDIELPAASASNQQEVTIADVDYDLEETPANIPVYIFQNRNVTSAADEDSNLKDFVTRSNYAFEISAVDQNDNGDIDCFVVYKFAVDQIASIGTKSFTTANLTGTIKFEDVTTYEGMDEDDLVIYTAAKYTVDNVATFAKATVVAGDVTATKGNFEFAVDGTWYEAVYNITTGVDSENLTMDKFAVGDTIKDAVVVNGYVFTASASASANIEDYAIVVDATGAVGLNGPQAKLMFSNGEKTVVDTDKDYSTAPNKMIGWLVTYDINSDDEYVLTEAINTQEENANSASGFDYVKEVAALDEDDMSNTDKVKYIDGMNISDTAVIFMKDGTDYKVITGAQLKSIKGDTITQAIAYANKDSATGFKTVEMAKIVTSSKALSADSLYGYVTADPIKVSNSDEKTVTELTIWTENGKSVTLKTKYGLPSEQVNLAAKGAFISFTVNADNEIDSIASAGVTTAAVTSYDGTYVIFDESGVRQEITDDTVVIYIDADKDTPTGVETGKIKMASKTGVASGSVDERYYDNVAYKAANGEVEVLYVDVANDINDKM